MEKKILVLGGSGFLGPELIKLLAQEKCKITVFNRGNRNNRIPLKDFRFLKGNRNQTDDMSRLKNLYFDVVFDLSGLSPDSQQTAVKMINTKKYIFISTIAVYKRSNKECLDESCEIGFNPVWGQYGYSKARCEQVLLEDGPGKFQVFILRPAYIVGFKDVLYRENLLFKQMRNNRDIFLPDDGTSRIQFIHKDDLIEICTRLADNTFETGIYNAAADEVFTINDWIAYLAKMAGCKPRIRYSTFGDNNRKIFPYSPADIIVDSSKIKQNLNVKIENCSNKSDFWAIEK